MALTELAEKGADIDVLRQMVQFMAQRLMELDVEGRCGAGYDEKSAERLNSRNSYRERTWDTRAGSVELKIPKAAPGQLLPGVPGASTHRRESRAARLWATTCSSSHHHAGRLFPTAPNPGTGSGPIRDNRPHRHTTA